MRNRSSCTAALSLFLLVGCGSDCKVETVEYTKSVTALGYTGATQGVPVARFDVHQNFITHTPYAACGQGPLADIGVVDLKITSLVQSPLFLKYDVQGLNTTGTPVWSHQDTIGVTIAPKATLAVGQITTSSQPLGTGDARVLLQAADLVP